MSFAFLSFFVVVAFLLAEANFIVFSALKNIFEIPYRQSFLLAMILTFFSGGFILMLILEKYFGNYLVRLFYLLTSIWMGAFVYVFISSAAYVFISLFFNIPNYVGLVLFLLALGVSLYGISHGRKIVIKKIEVALPNLPDAWRDKKAVWMSDIHLNSVRRAKFAKKIVDVSNSLNPDVVFIGGDMFDGTHRPDPHIISRPFKDLLSVNGVFFIPGNHEEFDDPALFLETVESLGIKVLRDEMVVINGLQIIGVDYLNTLRKDQFEEVLNKMNFDKNKASILLKHEPKDLDIAEKVGINFQISGHTHRGQQWPFNYLTYIAYKGFAYGLKKFKSMFVYVSSGAGGWGPPVRVGSDGEIVEITLK